MIDVRKENLITLDEAAEILSVSIKTIRNRVAGIGGPRLETVKIGRAIKTTRTACQEWVESQQTTIDVIPFRLNFKTDYKSAMEGLRKKHGMKRSA